MRWPISVPKIDANVTRATVVEWLVREGEHVEVGAPVVELETEKAVYTVEAEQAGVIGGIAVGVGEKVPVGTRLAFVDDGQVADSPSPVGVRILAGEDGGRSPPYNPRCDDLFPNPVVDEYAVDDYSEALLGATRGLAGDSGIAVVGRALPASSGLVAGETRRTAPYERRLPKTTRTPSPSARQSDGPGLKVAAAQGLDQASGDDRGVLVIGAGRHAIEVIDALQACGVTIHGCLDARVPVGKEVYPGVRVVGLDRELAAMVGDGFRTAYIGIGGFDNLDVRIRLFSLIEELGAAAPPLIHPSAHVAPSSELGAGTTVLAHASVGPMNRVGRNCVITQNAVVSHHCCIGDNVVLSPNAALAAGVVVEDDATIGMGVTVYHDVHIGPRAMIVNGMHVLADVPAGTTLKRDLMPAAHLRTACRAS